MSEQTQDQTFKRARHGLMPIAMRYLSLICLLMILTGLLIGHALFSIHTLSEDTRDNVLKSVSDNLRTAVNLERLSRFAQILYRSNDPEERRRYMLAAHVLSQDATFDGTPSMASIAHSVATRMRTIHALRGEQHELMTHAADSFEEFARMSGRRDRTPALKLGLKALRTQDSEDLAIIAEKLMLHTESGNPGLDRKRATPLRTMVKHLRESAALGGRIDEMWTEISSTLDTNVGKISTRTVSTASDRFTVIAEKSKQTLAIGAACFLIILAGLGMVVLLVRRDILRPILNSVSILDQVQRGDIPERFPGARLRELDDIGSSVERSARLVRQIAERTDELERTNAALVREISEHRKTEAQLQKAMAKAEAAGRAKSDFLAGMSHEIRTPMNTILGMADLMLETDLTDRQLKYITTFKTSGHLLMGILNDILDFSKIESGQLELERHAFEPDRRIWELTRGIAQKAEAKGVDFRLNIADGVPEVVIGDSGRTSQILINLLDNAVKFTEEGYVSLTVEARPGRDADGVNLCFTISDTGIGISEEKQELIFGRFTQADASTTRKYGGSGLGLSISRALTELMGGSMSVLSTEGEGTTFQFTVPYVKGSRKDIPDERQKDRTQKLEKVLQQRDLSMLIAEDSDNNRALIELFLQNSVKRIDFAENGADAVALFRTGKYDAVLMDIQMPELDGYGATRMIRALEDDEGRSRTPIIALTANAMDQDRLRCLEVGCDHYLSKPVRKAALLEAIIDALD